MGPTYVKLVWVAGSYTITKGNMFGTLSRITGRGTLDRAKADASRNALINNIKTVHIKVGSGDWKQVAA